MTITSYSQCGQDLYVYNTFFKDAECGFYVDIGAHDGKDKSNTLLFEQLGWDGVCIEPLPWVYERLTQNRTCRCINAVVSICPEDTVEFCAIEGYSEMLSGIIQCYDQRHIERILREEQSTGSTRKKITVKNLRFGELELPSNIDYLSLDTEGCELDILSSIDFSASYIKVISFENNYNEPLSEHLTRFYNVVNQLGPDFILLRK